MNSSSCVVGLTIEKLIGRYYDSAGNVSAHISRCNDLRQLDQINTTFIVHV